MYLSQKPYKNPNGTPSPQATTSPTCTRMPHVIARSTACIWWLSSHWLKSNMRIWLYLWQLNRVSCVRMRWIFLGLSFATLGSLMTSLEGVGPLWQEISLSLREALGKNKVINLSRDSMKGVIKDLVRIWGIEDRRKS